MSSDSNPGIWIVSTRGPDDEPVCEITWGPVQWYASVADVRQTAIDLVSCAAYAEWIHLLLVKVKVPPKVVEQVTVQLMRLGGRTDDHGLGTTINLYPASGRNKAGVRQPAVIMRRGGLDGMVSPAEAREMALAWFAAAEATDSDQVLSEALRALHPGVDAERLFAYMRELRKVAVE